ncbi:MAG: hypothetical protein LBT38_01685 [Deltaproteobacteria bacterium]|nr:hypothetical protein [Deltaproteobacteria bacterium]
MFNIKKTLIAGLVLPILALAFVFWVGQAEAGAVRAEQGAGLNMADVILPSQSNLDNKGSIQTVADRRNSRDNDRRDNDRYDNDRRGRKDDRRDRREDRREKYDNSSKKKPAWAKNPPKRDNRRDDRRDERRDRDDRRDNDRPDRRGRN